MVTITSDHGGSKLLIRHENFSAPTLLHVMPTGGVARWIRWPRRSKQPEFAK
jgi:hypothetical protein